MIILLALIVIVCGVVLIGGSNRDQKIQQQHDQLLELLVNSK